MSDQAANRIADAIVGAGIIVRFKFWSPRFRRCWRVAQAMKVTWGKVFWVRYRDHHHYDVWKYCHSKDDYRMSLRLTRAKLNDRAIVREVESRRAKPTQTP